MKVDFAEYVISRSKHYSKEQDFVTPEPSIRDLYNENTINFTTFIKKQCDDLIDNRYYYDSETRFNEKEDLKIIDLHKNLQNVNLELIPQTILDNQNYLIALTESMLHVLYYEIKDKSTYLPEADYQIIDWENDQGWDTNEFRQSYGYRICCEELKNAAPKYDPTIGTTFLFYSQKYYVRTRLIRDLIERTNYDANVPSSMLKKYHYYKKVKAIWNDLPLPPSEIPDFNDFLENIDLYKEFFIIEKGKESEKDWENYHFRKSDIVKLSELDNPTSNNEVVELDKPINEDSKITPLDLVSQEDNYNLSDEVEVKSTLLCNKLSDSAIFYDDLKLKYNNEKVQAAISDFQEKNEELADFIFKEKDTLTNLYKIDLKDENIVILTLIFDGFKRNEIEYYDEKTNTCVFDIEKLIGNKSNGFHGFFASDIARDMSLKKDKVEYQIHNNIAKAILYFRIKIIIQQIEHESALYSLERIFDHTDYKIIFLLYDYEELTTWDQATNNEAIISISDKIKLTVNETLEHLNKIKTYVNPIIKKFIFDKNV